MAITKEEIEHAKSTLPFGWGRFGKAIERLAEISEPGESLLASCVTLNPDYQYKQRFRPGGLLSTGHALHELTKATNVVLACTSERLIVISTGAGGAPRDELSIPYDGLELVSRDKKEFVLDTPDGRLRFRGAAKHQLPALIEALAARARPADASPA